VWRGSEAMRTSNLAVNQDAAVVTWPNNHQPTVLSNVVAIAARGPYAIALRNDGSVLGWSSIPMAYPSIPAGLTNATSIACGGGSFGQTERGMALRHDGTVLVWKSGLPVEEPVPTGLGTATAIAAGAAHSLAIISDGTVFGWGYNREGQATGASEEQNQEFSSGLVRLEGTLLREVTEVACGDTYSLALKKNGTLVQWGSTRQHVDIPQDLIDVTAIAVGDGFCLAITTKPPSTAPR
jgi:alpha-tubulin suppressor-like RCC1 family protein